MNRVKQLFALVGGQYIDSSEWPEITLSTFKVSHVMLLPAVANLALFLPKRILSF
jgi:hypothetical protein